MKREENRMINIKSRRECFFDSFLLNEEKTTADFRVHQPAKKECAMVINEAWENHSNSYPHIIHDGKKYIMYYVARGNKPDARYSICYAESDDGFEWRKPALNLCEFDGSKENNIVIDQYTIPDQNAYDNFCAFYDTNPACPPEKKYKACVAWCGHRTLRCFSSPDGINFSVDCVITNKGEFDSLNRAFWDAERGRYLCYYRNEHEPELSVPLMDKSFQPSIIKMLYDPERGMYRAPGESDKYFSREVSVIESPDFVNWTEPVRLSDDGADMQYYTNGVMPYPRAPHIYIGLATRYVERKAWTPNYDELCGAEMRKGRIQRQEPRAGLALTDTLFIVSRDGYHFKRYDEAFMRPGPEHPYGWMYGDCYPTPYLLETPSDIPGADGEYSIYSAAGHQSYIPNEHKLYRYTIRKDGFVSLHAGGKEETIVTKPFVYEGDKLYANIETSARGSAYFTLISGDERYESHEIFGDSIDKRIHFLDDDAVQKCEGKEIVLEIKLLDADIYSIKFER